MGRFWLVQAILALRKPGPDWQGEKFMYWGGAVAWAEVGRKFQGSPPLPGGQLERDA